MFPFFMFQFFGFGASLVFGIDAFLQLRRFRTGTTHGGQSVQAPADTGPSEVRY